MEHVDALVVGGHVGVCGEVLCFRHHATLHARDATDTHGRDRVKVERAVGGAAIDIVHAAAIVCVG